MQEIREDEETAPVESPVTPPIMRRPSNSRMKSSRRCSQLIEEFDLDGLEDLLEESEDAEQPAPAPTPRRSQMKKSRQKSMLIELGEDDLEDLQAAADEAEEGQMKSPRPQRRNSSIVLAGDDPNELSYRPSALQLYAPPRQRQQWGQRQILPRVNWGDLFFDLFYVAAAYNVSITRVLRTGNPTNQLTLCFPSSRPRIFLWNRLPRKGAYTSWLPS